MDLKNQHVIHKTLGNGVVVSQDDNYKYITVEFSSKTSRFPYPSIDTFEKFLTLVDSSVHAAVLKEAEKIKIAAENARAQDEEEKRVAEQVRRNAEPVARTSERTFFPAKQVIARSKRVPGMVKTFYVFQGSTFNIEYSGGFIWAPQYNPDGKRFFYWDNMMLVEKGDIVFHGCRGDVVAVSIAVSDCYDCDRPEDRTFEKNSWIKEGRRVDLKYTTFRNPIKTSDFRGDILKYCKKDYSPFDKNGNGNMGYLYELDCELARIFLRAAVDRNPYLDLECVQSFFGH